MVRITDSNVVMTGHEPKFDRELSKLEIATTLNWYTQNKDTREAMKYANDYFKKNYKLNVEDVIKNYPVTFGFVCRILNNGGILSEKDKVWFNDTIAKIKDDLAKPKVDVVVDDKPVQPNIQDRIREKASECIGELEGLLDEYILSKFTTNPKPYGIMHTLKYLDKHEELKLESVTPKDIIGALQLWVYNTKSRKLGCYNAEDASGLSVKGSTIINFNEIKSTQKKLRKPEVTLPEVLKGGKVYLRTALDEIKAVASTLNGRLNTDTILLRITK